MCAYTSKPVYMAPLRRRFLRIGPYRGFLRLLKTTHLRGRPDVSYMQVLDVFLTKIKKDEIEPRANGVAFNFTLSIFPAIIFLFTLIPYVPIQDLDAQIIMSLAQVLPRGIWVEAAPTISDIVSRPRGRLLSFGFIFTVITATNGMMVLMDAFNKCYRTSERRSYLRRRLVALLLTIILGGVLIVAIAFLIWGQNFLGRLEDVGVMSTTMFLLYDLLRYAVVFMIFFLAISFIYYIAPAVHRRWRFFSLGSIVAANLCILITNLFSYYLNNFATYNRLYGSIGTFIGLMLWFYLLSIIILVGFEINASIDEAKYGAVNVKKLNK
jgi:membrane protein